jgi:hypothetical protein
VGTYSLERDRDPAAGPNDPREVTVLTAFWWAVIVVGVLVLIGLAVLYSGALKRGDTPPGPPIGEDLKSDHDEPLEDTARPPDRTRHEQSGIDVAQEGRDISRLGGR